MRIIITGSAGYVGRNLYKALSEKYEVVGIDIVKGDTVDHIHDLKKVDPNSVLHLFTKNDVLIHLAGRTSVTKSYTDSSVMMDNIKMAWNLKDFPGKIMNASSTEVGTGSPYGISKEVTEKLFHTFSDNVVNMRFGNIIGAGMPKGKMITDFIDMAVNNGLVEHGRVDLMRHFITLDYLISEILHLIDINHTTSIGHAVVFSECYCQTSIVLDCILGETNANSALVYDKIRDNDCNHIKLNRDVPKWDGNVGVVIKKLIEDARKKAV